MPLAENISERLSIKPYATGGITSNQLAANSALGATGGQQLRFVDHDLSLQKQDIQNPEKRTDRQAPLGRQGTGRVQGSIRGILSPGTYEMLMEAVMRGTWASMAAVGASDLGSIQVSGDSFVFASGNPVSEGLRVGHIGRFSGLSTTGNNDKDFLILGFSGTSGRKMTVFPSPSAQATDAAWTFAGQGAQLTVPSSNHVSRKFGIESYQTDLDRAELFKECRIGGMEINSNADDNMTVNFAVLGRAREFLPTSGSPYFSGPAAQTTADVCGAVGGVLRVNGQNLGVVTAFGLSMNLNPQGPSVRGQNFVPEIFLGPAQISGNISFFLDENAYDLIETFDDETRVQLLLWLTNSQADAGEGLALLLPYVQLGSLTKQDDGSGGKIVSGTFTAGPYAGTPPTGVTSSIMQVVDTAVSP